MYDIIFTMKFVFKKILISVFVLTFFFFFNQVDPVLAAPSTPQDCENAGGGWNVGDGICEMPPSSTASTQTNNSSGVSNQNPAATTQGDINKKIVMCPGSWYDEIGCNIMLAISNVFFTVIGTVFYLATQVFDFGIKTFIFNISDLFPSQLNSSDNVGIYTLWSIIRDISNITIFFGSMYVGVRYIIGSTNLDFRKAVTRIIMYALLVNFTWAISKFLIDISNVVSLYVNTAFSKLGLPGSSISDAFMQRLGYANFITSYSNPSAPPTSGLSMYGSWSLIWMAILFGLVGAAVFVYAAFMIIVRAVILIICVITSPFMMISGFFPGLDNLNSKWRENFFGQLMFGPILMLGLFVTLVIINSAMGGSNNGFTTLSAGATGGDYTQSTAKFFFALIALLASVKIAGSVSGGAGRAIGDTISGVTKGAGLALATGGTGFAFRNTAGRIGASLANSQWVKNTTKESSASRRMTTSLMSRAGERLANKGMFGRDSYSEKNYAKISKTKTQYQAEHGEQLKSLGLTDFLAQVKNKEDLEKFEAELANRRKNKSDKSKWNEDVLGKDSEARNLELYKDATKNNVAIGKRGQYIDKVNALKELEEAPLELQRINPTRADRLKVVEEGRNKQIEASKLRTEARVKSKEDELQDIEDELFGLEQQKNNVRGATNERVAIASIDRDIQEAQTKKADLLKDIAESQVQNATVVAKAERSLEGNAVGINNLDQKVSSNENVVGERKAEIENTKQDIESLKNTTLASKYRSILNGSNSNTTQNQASTARAQSNSNTTPNSQA
jgi:hypothetical protein